MQGDPVVPERAAGAQQSLAQRAGELLERAPARARDLPGVLRSELLAVRTSSAWEKQHTKGAETAQNFVQHAGAALADAGSSAY